MVRKKSCIAGLRYLQVRSHLGGAIHLNSVTWKSLPSLNLQTADATNSSVPRGVSVCQLNAKLLLCSPSSNKCGWWLFSRSVTIHAQPTTLTAASCQSLRSTLSISSSSEPSLVFFQAREASVYPSLHTWECVRDHDVVYSNTKGLQLKEMNFCMS